MYIYKYDMHLNYIPENMHYFRTQAERTMILDVVVTVFNVSPSFSSRSIPSSFPAAPTCKFLFPFLLQPHFSGGNACCVSRALIIDMSAN